MKRVILAIIAVMAFMNTAFAEIVVTAQSYENVHNFATKSIPDATTAEIGKCHDAVKNGGSYTIERKKIRIECSEEEMVVFRRLF